MVLRPAITAGSTTREHQMSIRQLERGATLLVAISAVAGAAFLATAMPAHAGLPDPRDGEGRSRRQGCPRRSPDPTTTRTSPSPSWVPTRDRSTAWSSSRTPARRRRSRATQGLTTSFTGGTAAGKVAFPLEPVTTGHYFPFAGQEPCHGRYVIAVQEQPRSGRFQRVRTYRFLVPVPEDHLPRQWFLSRRAAGRARWS